MKKSLKIAAANLGAVIALATTLALPTFLAGCSVKKIEYEKDDKGTISYRIYQNDHWLNTESSAIRGGMTQDGRFEYSAEGMKSSPSEEFNKTMQTYTTAFVQLAQIAAAAYNPSASGVAKSQGESAQAATASGGGSASPTVVVNAGGAASGQQQGTAAATNAAECVDCTIK